MYLKSIEMQGFKSFADKTTVVFDRGVTAVVGPNGSGKSNITESLRWALGESSAKSLRGGKMPDVIFAGTENRKPLNFASVVVTLDNSRRFIAQKGDDITVERRIYRSGESEYLIDRQKVRLRDIHDLFMDTGLGRDSFSIISQGRVEEIFNSKPEERRAIFEEAAGVLKYKTRKKETEAKLSQTQDNVDRLEDIIHELDHQVTPLQKQAEVAQQFLELDKKRSELDLIVLVNQIRQGRKELSYKEEALEAVKGDLSVYYQQRNQLEKQYQQGKENRHQIADKIEKEQATVLELTKLSSDLERKMDVYQLESSQHASRKQDAQERLQALTEKSLALAEDISQKKLHLEQLEQEVDSLNKQLRKTDHEISRFSEDPDKIMEELRDEYVALLQKEADTSNQLTKVEQDLLSQLRLSDSKREELEQLEKEKQDSESSLQKGKEKLEQSENTLRQLLQEYQLKTQELAQVESLYQSAQKGMFDCLDHLKAQHARKASLENILKNHSNFYAGVKAVLQEKEKIGGIIGAVSEHINFSPEYQLALEVALGASSQHIIVEEEGAAKSAIAFLKKHRYGRATFLPLTTLKSRSIPDYHQKSLEKADGYLGTAEELVSYDHRLAVVFQHLLGATAVFDTIDHATQAAKLVRFQVRMVTLDGSEIRSGGAFAGGSIKNQSTIFIKPELEAISQEIVKQETLLKDQEKKVAILKEQVEAAKSVLQHLQSEGEEARLQEQRDRLSYEQLNERFSDVQRLYELQQAAIDEPMVADLQAKKIQLQTELKAYEEQKSVLQTQIEDVKSNREVVQERLQQLQEQKSSLIATYSQQASEVKFEKATIERLVGEETQLREEQELLQEVIAQKAKVLDDTNVETLQGQLSEVLERKEKSQQKLIQLRFEQEDIAGQLDDVEERLEKMRLQNEEWIRKQTKLESECDQIGTSLRQILLRLTEQYKKSFEEVNKEVVVMDELTDLEQQLKGLEQAIRKLGSINLDAIEQYKEVSERLAFLGQQREDVLASRDLLLEMIHEMDGEVKERFKETFEAIRTSFQETFRQIFGGGKADLLLTSSDLLTAGVDISVQPPGKKIQSLNLMSGGEKALSALALLFSIIRVKTIPFVILDEVEAALDEANVKRFGDYLNRFDQSSQFIVVTHRKGTMAAADAIYGVTMQESGVSRIVSVKLKEIEKELT